MNNELWKPVPGFDGFYEVSSFGRVRTKRRQGSPGGELKSRQSKKGYPTVRLHSNGKYYAASIHRLVALAFIDNPENLPCVNHKDEVKSNNHVENLEWCSYKYNNNYGTARTRASVARYKPCVGVWPNGEKKQYNSCTLASKDTGIAQGNIWGACNGLWKHAGGVEWHYVIEDGEDP